MKKHYKKMTPEAFKQVKGLLDLKLSFSQITSITGKSVGTIGWIKKSSSYEDYKKRISEYLNRNKSVPSLSHGNSSNKTEAQNAMLKEMVALLSSQNIILKKLEELWETPGKS